MLWCVLGLVLGASAVIAALLFVQYLVIRGVAPGLGYRFDKYVFETKNFPAGDFEQGRVVRRCLFPARVSIRFFDGNFDEVKEATKPGRYGAVITMKLNWGIVEHRFVTLYRTPQKVFWWNGPMTVDAELPPNTGVDPAVLERQRKEIGRIIRDGFAGDGQVSAYLSTLLAGLSEMSPNDLPVVERHGILSRDTAWWFELRKRLGLEQRYHYLADLPDGYDADPEKRWPLIVYLHGGNQNGHDLDLVRSSGLAAVIANGYKLPAVVISPQSPWFEEWIPQVLSALLDEVTMKYRIDPDRIYMTGISSGAIGSWKMALEYPGRLAAIFPVGGDSDPDDVEGLVKLPIWTFTGLLDDVIPAANVLRLVEAIRKAGGNPHVTAYPSRGHDTEFMTYKMPALYTWLFAQKRGQSEVLTPGLPDALPKPAATAAG